MSNFDIFAEIYAEELELAIRNHPNEYRWPVQDIHMVVYKMIEALKEKKYSIDGRALMATCKRLNIRVAHKYINAYLDDQPLSKAG